MLLQKREIHRKRNVLGPVYVPLCIAPAMLPESITFSELWESTVQSRTSDCTGGTGSASVVVAHPSTLLLALYGAYQFQLCHFVQAQQARLDKRVPVVDTEDKAAAVSQLMCILQQHHHPLLCRSYMVPCFLTSSTTGMVRPPALSVHSNPQQQSHLETV